MLVFCTAWITLQSTWHFSSLVLTQLNGDELNGLMNDFLNCQNKFM